MPLETSLRERSRERRSPEVEMVSRLALLVILGTAGSLCAHPLLEETYDRTIVVRVTPKGVIVEYSLEVEAQFARNEVVTQMTLKEIGNVTSPEMILERYARSKVLEIGQNLLARLDGQTLTFTCTRTSWQLLDHLRCDYRFEAPWRLEGGKAHDFFFREANFFEEKGAFRLSLVVDEGLKTLKTMQPDEALKKKPPSEFAPGERDRLRNATAAFTWPGGELQQQSPSPKEPTEDTTPRERSLVDLFLLLGMAFVLGAAHALTPGHGKTLVAAYLVGERGTFGHAVLLGLVTTFTHTGIILLIAAVLPLLIPSVKLKEMQQLLGFIGGLLVVVLGFWLLQRRLAGRSDHFHLGGHHHHHHDGVHHHLPPGQTVGLWSLIVLGITGGLVPCTEAMVLFVASVGQAPGWAFFVLLAFSVGLASVLVAIGLGVVWAKKTAVARWGESVRLKRIARILPVVTAVLITAMGLWLCYDSLHTQTH